MSWYHLKATLPRICTIPKLSILISICIPYKPACCADSEYVLILFLKVFGFKRYDQKTAKKLTFFLKIVFVNFSGIPEVFYR